MRSWLQNGSKGKVVAASLGLAGAVLVGCSMPIGNDNEVGAPPASSGGTTTLAVSNTTGSAVTVLLTLSAQGAKQGAWITDVASFPASWGISRQGALNGRFNLPANSTVSFPLPANTGVAGNVAFGGGAGNPGCGQQPGFPNAATLGEFTLGVPSNGFPGQETVDISTVNGANVYMGIGLGGAGPWNAGAGYPNVTSASSGVIGTNANRVGVFGWQATNCTSSVNPPNPTANCPAPVNAPSGPELSSQPNCTLQRTTEGGTVTFTFNGFTPGSSN